MTARKFVPLKLDGVGIGTATVYEDGRIECVMSSPNFMGQVLYEQIFEGAVGALDISPVDSELTPARRPDIEISDGNTQVANFYNNQGYNRY